MTEKQKPIRYCYREVELPKDAYIALLFTKTTGEKATNFIYPLSTIYLSQSILIESVKIIKKEMERKGKSEIYGVIVIKLKLSRKYPLKKEHWMSPPSELNDDYSRIRSFLEMMNNTPELYSILVLPRLYDLKTRTWQFLAWIPVLLTTDDAKIESLIVTSDQPVDNSAKSMGIYSIEYAKGIDLKTGTLIRSDKSKFTKEADC